MNTMGRLQGVNVNDRGLLAENCLPSARGNETHEQFLQRVSKVFPVASAGAWSRIERLVFNQLMSRLIFKHGYGSISNAMLNECRDEMRQVIQRYASN